MSTTQQPEALAADHSEQTLEMVARWYMIDKDGMAMLCTDREDAEKEAKNANMAWPHTAPHRAVQLVEAADVEALRTGYAAARLEIESLEDRIKTMAEEHADELMVAHLDGRMRAAQPVGAQQPGAADLPEARLFTKKPVTITAIQWTGHNLREVITFTDGPPYTRTTHAGMAWEAYADLVARDGLKIYTLEGKMLASPGDWIIRGVKGELYPCKDEIFRMTYEPAVATAIDAAMEAARKQGGA